MKLKSSLKNLLLKPALFCITLLSAQTSPQLAVTPPDQVTVKHGGAATVKVVATLSDGFHLNSHTPAEDYLIPLSLKWTSGALEAGEIVYPKPQLLKIPFSKMPLSVLTGKFEITTRFKAGATVGPSTATGKLRYQACNDKSCFPPKTVDVKVPVEVQ